MNGIVDRLGRVSVLLVLALAQACGSSESASTEQATRVPSPPPPTPPPAPMDVPPAEATPRAEDESFVVELRIPETELHSGQLAQLTLHIEGKSGWHLNQDFPVSVELQAPATVGFVKTSLTKDDAASWTDESGQFDLPFSPTGEGDFTVHATISFAMCTASTCAPKTQVVAVRVPVHG